MKSKMEKLIILMAIVVLLFSCSTKEHRKNESEKTAKEQLKELKQKAKFECPDNNNLEKDIRWTKNFLMSRIPDLSSLNLKVYHRSWSYIDEDNSQQEVYHRLCDILKKKHRTLFKRLQREYRFSEYQIFDSIMKLDGIMIIPDEEHGYFVTGNSRFYKKNGIDIYAINESGCTTIGITYDASNPYIQINFYYLKKTYDKVCDLVGFLGVDSLKISYPEFCWAVIAQEIWHAKNPDGGEWVGEKISLCIGKEFYLLFRIADVMTLIDKVFPEGGHGYSCSQFNFKYLDAYKLNGGSIEKMHYSKIRENAKKTTLYGTEIVDIHYQNAFENCQVYLKKSLKKNPKFLDELLEYCKQN